MSKLRPLSLHSRAAATLAEFEALERTALSDEEVEVLVPRAQALIGALAAALPPGSPAAGELAGLAAQTPADVPALRLWLARAVGGRVAARGRGESSPTADLERALAALWSGWQRQRRHEQAALRSFACARRQGAGVGLIFLAVALSVVPFAMADCMDAARALRSRDAGVEDQGCGPDTEAAVVGAGAGRPA